MGAYDVVYVKCPDCGALSFVQSKSGPCSGFRYPLEDVPEDVAASLHNRTVKCYCGSKWLIDFGLKPKRLKGRLMSSE